MHISAATPARPSSTSPVAQGAKPEEPSAPNHTRRNLTLGGAAIGAAGGAIIGASLADWSSHGRGSLKERIAGGLILGVGGAVFAGAEMAAIGFGIGTLVD